MSIRRRQAQSNSDGLSDQPYILESTEFAMRYASTQFGNMVGSRRCGPAFASSIQLICMLFTLLTFAQIGMAQANATKTVLLLYDGGREFSGIALIDRNFEYTLNDVVSNRVTIFREYMDLTRIRQTNYEAVLRDFYRFKYANSKPDVIVAVRDRPLDFLLKPGGDLFPGVPIVSAAMDLRQVKSRKLPATVT